VQKRQLLVGRHHQQPVGLSHCARDLGQELRPGDADGDRQSNLLAHLDSQPLRDLGRRPRDAVQAADIQKRLVDRQGLDDGCDLLEHFEHGSAGLAVGRDPRRHHHRVGAQSPGLKDAHGRAHATALGLVARRQDNAGADDHRPPVEPGVIALFD